MELAHGRVLEQGDGGQAQQGDGGQVQQVDGGQVQLVDDKAMAQWLLQVCHGRAQRLPLHATLLWAVGTSCSHRCSL